MAKEDQPKPQQPTREEIIEAEMGRIPFSPRDHYLTTPLIRKSEPATQTTTTTTPATSEQSSQDPPAK